MRELISVERGANVRHNPCYLVDAANVPASNLETPVKGEELEKVAVPTKCHFNVNPDTRHEGIESSVLRKDNIFDHGLNGGRKGKSTVPKQLDRLNREAAAIISFHPDSQNILPS